MTYLTILGYITGTLTVGFTLYQALSRWTHSKARAKFREQNLDYVPFPSMFAQMFSGENFILAQNELVRKHGRIFGTQFLNANTIFVSVPEIAQIVLSKEFTNFTNRRGFDLQNPILNSFLTSVEDEQWKRLRSIVTPTFSTGKLRQMKPRMDDTVETLMKNFEESIEKSSIINVKELYGAFTMDTILQVAFGIKVDKDNKIVQMAKKIFSVDFTLKNILLIFLFLLSPKIAKLLGSKDETIEFFKEFSLKIIREKREELKDSKNMGKANNFLELLLEAEAENEKLETEEKSENKAKSVKFMSNDEMIAQCILFFIAAYDTTTSTISLASYFLALNPEIQERLYQEIESNLDKLKQNSTNQIEDPSKLVTFESLSQFEYLNAVVNETLRFYPPTFVERVASRDMKLETEDGSISFEVKKGDIINFPVYAMHHDPAQYPEPEKFDPERFLTNKQPTFHKYASLPFGSGPRNCVARSLALVEIKMALLNVVQRFKFSTCEQTKIPVEFYNNGSILTPKDVSLKVEKRF